MINKTRKDDYIYLVKHLSKLIDQDFDRRLSEYGLTCQQGRILFFVNRKSVIENKEVHQNDIEQEFHLSKSTVSGLVKRMEKKEIIIVKKVPPYAILEPSKKGKDIIIHLKKNKEDVIEMILHNIKKEDRTKLQNMLLTMIDNLGKERNYD